MLFRVKKQEAMFFKILNMKLASAFPAEARSSSLELRGLQGPGERGKPVIAVPASSQQLSLPQSFYTQTPSWYDHASDTTTCKQQPSSSSQQEWLMAQTNSRWILDGWEEHTVFSCWPSSREPRGPLH